MNYLLDTAITAKETGNNFKVAITWRNGILLGDEPKSVGGDDNGPDPYTLLAASLASCTVSTLKMYANRKEWSVEGLTVTVNFFKASEGAEQTIFERSIHFGKQLDDQQKERLLQIAKACPVSKILSNSISIQTNEVFA